MSPEIDLHESNHLNFNKSTNVVQYMVLDQFDNQRENDESWPFIQYTKVNFRWIIDLNVNNKASRRRLGVCLHDLGGKQRFFKLYRKYNYKGKIYLSDYIKIKNFCSSKDNRRIKSQATVEEKIFAITLQRTRIHNM